MKTSIIIGLSIVIFSISCGKKFQEVSPIRKNITESVFASGVLEAKNTYNLTAETDGYLSKINFEEGDIVSSGMVLASIENKQNTINTISADQLYTIAKNNTESNAPALLQAQNSIKNTKDKMDLDFQNFERYKKLYETNTISKYDYENAEIQYKTSKTNYLNALENYKIQKQKADEQVITNEAAKNINKVLKSNNDIKAIVGGKVYKKYKQIGDYVKKGEVIALIGDAENIYAKVNVDEVNINKILIGQEALVQLNTNKDKVYKGTVSEIYPSFDEGKQSFTCKIIFVDDLDFKIVNTQLQSNIIIGSTDNALLIPRNFLDFGGYVQVKDSSNKTKVETKFVSNEWVQVLSGIDEKSILITDNIKDNKMNTSEVGAQLSK